MGSHLRAFLHSRGVSIVTGLVLLVTGLFESIQPYFDTIAGNENKLGAHHGLALYGLVSFLRALTEVTKGAKEASEGLEKLKSSESTQAMDGSS